jgi:hypothetical protein
MTSTPIACFVSHDGIAITAKKMLLTVYNNSTVPITISEIAIFYNAVPVNVQGLLKVYSGNTLVWDGFETGSPVVVSDFSNDGDDAAALSIDPYSGVALKLFFNNNVSVNGTETISISFAENGCGEHTTNP